MDGYDNWKDEHTKMQTDATYPKITEAHLKGMCSGELKLRISKLK